jgi:succinoglycan biosynthesis protein ExoW
MTGATRANVLTHLFLARGRAHPEVSSHTRDRSDCLGGRVGRACDRVRTSSSNAPPDQALFLPPQQLYSTQRTPRSDPALAVIVPYFQNEAEILRRCLASIFDQKLNSKIWIHVIIVDDASPWPAKEELRDVQIPEHITVKIITRDNGGPGAARNTGLDYVPGETDFIAFIDSDDTWRVDHIQRALDALGSFNDLYFTDHLQWEGFSNQNRREFGARVGRSSTFRPHARVAGVWICANADIIRYAVQEVVAHTSTIVYRKSKLAKCRFDEELWYAEDDLFFLDLLFSSTHACVSTESEVSLGLGVNIFFSSWSWDSENNLKRCCHQLVFYTKVRRRPNASRELNETVRRAIRSHRPVVVFFIVRQLLKGRKVPLGVFVSLVRHDPQFITTFPANIVRAAARWVTGKFQGNPAFHQK